MLALYPLYEFHIILLLYRFLIMYRGSQTVECVENPSVSAEDIGADRNMIDDIFDTTYREKTGPKPPAKIVWRNVILMSLLHLSALYGVFLIPLAKPITLIWGKTIHTLLFINISYQNACLFGVRDSLCSEVRIRMTASEPALSKGQQQ